MFGEYENGKGREEYKRKGRNGKERILKETKGEWKEKEEK